MKMQKFRVLLNIRLCDLLVEAKDEEDAKRIVYEEYKNFRPFGGMFRLMEIKLRKPWKKQLGEIK
jgi:hypothetical protein